MAAMPVPTAPCILLTAIAPTGERPTDSSTGNEISPPPPPMASTKPATTPTRASTKSDWGSSTSLGLLLAGAPGIAALQRIVGRNVDDAAFGEGNVDHRGH